MDEVIAWILAFVAIRYGPQIFRAASDVLTGKETVERSIGSLVNPAPTDRFEITLSQKDIPFKESLIRAYEVEVRGRICTRSINKAVLVTSILDITDEPTQPVIASFDFQQEEYSAVYQERVELGSVAAGNFFPNWVKVARVIPSALIAPFSGQRKLLVMARVLEADDVVFIEHGFHKEGTEHHAYASTELIVALTEKGWQEASAERREAVEIVLQAAVALGGVDGSFDVAEARVIQEWIRYQVHSAEVGQREALKERLNETFKTAHAQVRAGQLKLDQLVERLASFDLPSINRQLLDLLGAIASADQKISPEELELIRSVGDRLGVSQSDVAALAEAQFLAEGVSLSGDASPETIVGIGAEWSKEEIQAHLRKEFAKWNGRIQALSEPEERRKAQEMIDLIASLRKKYS